MTDIPHRDDTSNMDDTPDILPGYQEMLQAMAKPGGTLRCTAGRVPQGVLEMEGYGLLEVIDFSPEAGDPTYALTKRGKAYVQHRLG
ncbi:hypothetical protein PAPPERLAPAPP_04570 [Brevundimonas phage vB_BpoS-Papperlapapp]|nr:hypothetical protein PAPPERLAPAPP_04570 [Brevundimonas phage vB_BpoS-Papperlapapp]